MPNTKIFLQRKKDAKLDGTKHIICSKQSHNNSFDITFSLICAIKDSLSLIKTYLLCGKMELLRLVNDVQTREFTEDTIKIIKWQYSAIISKLYRDIKNIIDTKHTNEYGGTICILANREITNEPCREIGLTYITKNGIVTNNCIAKIDTISIKINELLVEIIFGENIFEIPTIPNTENLEITIQKLMEINELFLALEKQLIKNINIACGGIDVVNIIKKTLSC